MADDPRWLSALLRELPKRRAELEQRAAASRQLRARQRLVDERCAYFTETNDPLYAWEVIKLCTRFDLPFPPPVARYLAETAERLLKLPEQAKGALKRLPWALGFEADRTVSFLNYARLPGRAKACRTVALKVLDGAGIEAAIEITCQEQGVSKSLLRSWLNEFFPGRGDQRWPPYLQAATDPQNTRFDAELFRFLQT